MVVYRELKDVMDSIGRSKTYRQPCCRRNGRSFKLRLQCKGSKSVDRLSTPFSGHRNCSSTLAIAVHPRNSGLVHVHICKATCRRSFKHFAISLTATYNTLQVSTRKLQKAFSFCAPITRSGITKATQNEYHPTPKHDYRAVSRSSFSLTNIRKQGV